MQIVSLIVAGVIAVLASLLGIERSRRKKAQQKQEEAETQAKLQEIKREVDSFAQLVKDELSEKVVKTKQKEVQKVEEVMKSENQTQTYNDIVKDFNSKESRQ